MSFRKEIQDFSEGLKSGQEFWQRNEDRKYRNAQFENIRLPTDAELANQPGAPKGGGGVLSDTPQSKDGGKTGSIKIARTGDDEAAARRDAIASIESSGNYRAVGSQTKTGDRAYGRYQIMGNNIPVWTKQVLGRSMTPGEFLGDQAAQDQVFDVMFDNYVGQYGPEGAAQAWLGGPGSVGKTKRADMHGTSVGGYGSRFMAAYTQFGGTGSGANDSGTAVASAQPASAQPSKAKDPVSEEPAPDKEEEPEKKDEPSSNEPVIQVAEATPTNVGTPQVMTNFFAAAQPQAGGLSDPRDDQARPAMFAARGGVIPEFADGGTVDKYNPARAYTQPLPQTKSDFTPVAATTGSNVQSSPVTGGYQQRFRDMQAARAQPVAAAAPAAQPQQSSYAQQLLDWEQTNPMVRTGGGYGSQGNMWAPRGRSARMPQPDPNNAADVLLARQYSDQFKQRYAGTYGGWGGGAHSSHFEEGGVIPEPGFARGGRVSRDETFQRLYRNEQQGSSRGEGDQGARDRAARRLSASEGRPTSTAYRPTADDNEPYFRPRTKPMPKSGVAKITKRGKPLLPRTAPTPEPRPEPDETTGSTSLVPAAGTPTEGYEPKARAAGTPFPPQPSTFPARPEVHSDNTYPVRPQQGPPVPPRVVQPGSKGHSEPPPGSAVIDIDPRRFGRSGGGAPPAIDNGMSTIPGVRNAVPGTDVPRGGTWVDANIGQPTAPPAIPDPTAVQGAWVNGQWVPFNTTAAPGQGFARGGKVDENVRSSAVRGRSYRPTFANSRADAAGYTTSSPGWRRDEEFPEAPRAASPRRGRGRASGGGGGVDPQTTGAIPTPSPRPILEDRETRWRGSDYPILEDRATRFRRPDVGGTPTLPYEPKNAPIGSTLNVPEAAPAAVPYADPYTVDVNTSPMDPAATAVPRYAAGGVIDDDEDTMALSPRAESADYTTSAPGRPAASRAPAAASPPEAAPEPADVEPTPHLLRDVSEAVKGGARFLAQHFGLNGRGDGAVPTPEAGAARQDGIRRFASGEGAMTSDEIQAIDDRVDPNRELSEGDRQMNRFAQTMNWFLLRGRKDDAAAAAAGLMQYGAQRFGKLGSMAGAAYKEYMQTKDPKDLENTTKFLSKAYEMIPDGAQMAVTIDPETHMLQATRVGADGEQEVYDVQPGEIPGLIQKTMDGSGYWQQVMSLGDPTGAHEKQRETFELGKEGRTAARDERDKLRERQWKREDTTDIRTYESGEEQRKHERDRGETLTDKELERKQKLEDQKALEEKTRREELLKESLLRTRPAKAGTKPVVDQDQMSTLLDQVDTINGKMADDKDNPELQGQLDEALSRLYDASGQDEDLMTKLGFPKADWRYHAGKPAGMPANAKRAGDGNWYKPDPNRPGKWIKITVESPAS